MTIAVTGATGLVGAALVAALRAAGTEVRALSRDPAAARARLPGVLAMPWDPAGVSAFVRGSRGVVNLAGENVFARRWSRRQRERLRASRVDRTRELVEAIGALPADARPRTLVSASAVGYYGPRDATELSEDAPPGGDFLATLCRDWEAAATAAEAQGVRVVCLRIGVVLAREGGALAAMRWPFLLFAGGPVLPGSQWVSWIHRDDLVSLIRFALDTPALRGPVNATAPGPATNREFSSAFGAALRRPSWLPVPGFALRLRFGPVARVLTTGQRVLPKAAQAAGFTFAHSDVAEAMRAAYAR